MVHCLHRNTSGWHRHRKSSRASNGSTAFPLDLLIFCPFSSCTCPRTITFSYGALLNKRVDSAIREWNHPRVWSTASEINCAGKLLLKYFFIFKWIVILCKRHGSGIEPAVQITSGTRFITLPQSGQVRVISSIYGRCSSTVSASSLPERFCQFFTASDTFLMSAALTLPDI